MQPPVLSRRRTRRALLGGAALLLASSLAGCDDILLFDVSEGGDLLVTCDALGRTAAIGDGAAPRHVAVVNAETYEVHRITSSTMALAWPRWCNGEVMAVVERRRLAILGDDARDLLTVAAGRLDQPTVSPGGAHVAVLHADRLGVPGTLRVVELRSDLTSSVVLEVEHALLGFTWVDDRTLLVAVATKPRAEPLDGGPGELVRVDLDGSRRTLVRAQVAGATWLEASGNRGLAVLPLGEPDGPIGLAAFQLDQAGARRGEATGVCDLWPCVDRATGRVLFTRAQPEKPSLEGELRLTSIDDPSRSAVVPTTGPVVAPRWLPGATPRFAYLTPDDRLVVQDLDGSDRTDLSARIKAACFGDDR